MVVTPDRRRMTDQAALARLDRGDHEVSRPATGPAPIARTALTVPANRVAQNDGTLERQRWRAATCRLVRGVRLQIGGFGM